MTCVPRESKFCIPSTCTPAAVVVREERIDETRVYRRREALSLKNVFQSRTVPSWGSDGDGEEEEVGFEDRAVGEACVDALLMKRALATGVDWRCRCLVAVAFKTVDCSSAAAGWDVILLQHGAVVLARRFCCDLCGLISQWRSMVGNRVAAEEEVTGKMKGVNEEVLNLLPSTEERIGALNTAACIFRDSVSASTMCGSWVSFGSRSGSSSSRSCLRSYLRYLLCNQARSNSRD